MLNLESFFNNDGISTSKNRTDGDFTGAGNTYPAEDLPPSNSRFECENIPFIFPDKSDGRNNNIALDGQHVPVPEGNFEAIYLLGASDSASLEDTVSLVFADDSRETVFLGLSSWRLCHNLKYGERVAVKCRGYHFPSRHVHTTQIGVDYGMWMQRLPVRRPGTLCTIEFPDNPNMHIFSLTLHRTTSIRETHEKDRTERSLQQM